MDGKALPVGLKNGRIADGLDSGETPERLRGQRRENECRTGTGRGACYSAGVEPVQGHRALAPKVLGFASLTVSDSHDEASDEGGRTIRDLAAAAGHRLAAGRIARDEVPAIRVALRELLALTGVDVVVVTGGTGLSPRDLTLEAVEPLLDRGLPGFGELFRMLSFHEVGAAAMLSRAAAGLAGERAVFVLPGSPKAVALAMERLILPEAAHLLSQARRPS